MGSLRLHAQKTEVRYSIPDLGFLTYSLQAEPALRWHFRKKSTLSKLTGRP